MLPYFSYPKILKVADPFKMLIHIQRIKYCADYHLHCILYDTYGNGKNIYVRVATCIALDTTNMVTRRIFYFRNIHKQLDTKFLTHFALSDPTINPSILKRSTERIFSFEDKVSKFPF